MIVLRQCLRGLTGLLALDQGFFDRHDIWICSLTEIYAYTLEMILPVSQLPLR